MLTREEHAELTELVRERIRACGISIGPLVEGDRVDFEDEFRQVFEKLNDLQRVSREERAAYHGDAFQLNNTYGPWESPDRVKGCPTLVMSCTMSPGETDPSNAVAQFEEQASHTAVVYRGHCEGMKELVCQLIERLYGLVRGDL